MILSFRRDKAFIYVLSDLELILGEVCDKLDIKVNSLATVKVVDNTRKFNGWNKIDTVDASNYLLFQRYDIPVTAERQTYEIQLPWRDYDSTQDIDVRVYLDGVLLLPLNVSANYDYEIKKVETTARTEDGGYVIDFSNYCNKVKRNGRNDIYTLPACHITIMRTTKNLPKKVKGVDLSVYRYDMVKKVSDESLDTCAIPWNTVSEGDIQIEVYVDGVLYHEDITDGGDAMSYKLYSTYIQFTHNIVDSQKTQTNVTFIRLNRKVTADTESKS